MRSSFALTIISLLTPDLPLDEAKAHFDIRQITQLSWVKLSLAHTISALREHLSKVLAPALAAGLSPDDPYRTKPS